MALIACIECGHQISDQAGSCPNCGHPLRATAAAPSAPQPTVDLTYTQPRKRNSGCAIVVVGFMTLIAVAFCNNSIRRSNQATPVTQRTPANSPARTASQLLADATDSSRSASARLFSAEGLIAKHPESDEAKSISAELPAMRETVRLESIGKQWNYSASDDEMSGKKMHLAMVSSTNTHDFDFPYAGPQRARLMLRKHPRYGSDVMLAIERGQLQCQSYSGCSVLVRFGDAEPRTYRASGAEDNSSEQLFIEGYADFQRRMQAVDVVRIQASIYQEGAPSWEFDVSGFKPDKMK